MMFPYPDRGYGGQTALWYDVVATLSEAQAHGSGNRESNI